MWRGLDKGNVSTLRYPFRRRVVYTLNSTIGAVTAKFTLPRLGGQSLGVDFHMHESSRADGSQHPKVCVPSMHALIGVSFSNALCGALLARKAAVKNIFPKRDFRNPPFESKDRAMSISVRASHSETPFC